MFDLHSHILPGLDDGSQSLDESLEMARMAAESGVRAVVATPHCLGDRARDVARAFILLRDALEETKIPLTLYPGMEIFGSTNTAELLKNNRLFTLNGSRYPLIEFAFRTDGEEETAVLRQVIDAGYTPVVAHPERYIYVQQDPELMNIWKEMGCLFQINRGSLLGRFGRREQAMAYALVDRGFATVVASDAHSPRMRTPWMRDVRELLREEFSFEAAEYLLDINPMSIVKNEDIHAADPVWF